MLGDGDSLTTFRAKRFHRSFEQKILTDHRIQLDLRPAIVVPVHFVEPDFDFVALAAAGYALG